MIGRTENSFLISAEPPELRVAELRGGALFDLNIERGGQSLGDIFKGRVENVIPGMDAAFVNIGLHRNALLHASDVLAEGNFSEAGRGSISEVARVGDEVAVQIARPPHGTKGARVTTQLSLAGRYVVLTSHADGIGVSRRLESEDERTRLRRLAEKLRPLDHGLIVRTEAEAVSESDLARDIQALCDQLQAIRQRAASATAPSLVHREYGLLGRLVRDRFTTTTSKIITDSHDVFQTLQQLTQVIAPQLSDRLVFHDEAASLFEKYGVEKELARAQERTVPLRSGGELVFDEAEALCAVDVNTGKFTGKKRLADTVLQTNLEAVEECARQIRLRDIGGIIVIDFIDMERRRDSIKVLDALEAALKEDRTRARIVQLSPSGLVEIIRRREGQSLRHVLHRSCPYCSGEGVIRSSQTVAIEARRRARTLAAHGASTLLVTLHPEAGLAFLGADDEWIGALENSFAQTRFWLRVEPGAHLEYCRVEALEDAPPLSWPAGTQLQLPPNAALLPAKEPRFTVHQNAMIRLENAADASGRAPALLEIFDEESASKKRGDKRWHFSARALLWHDTKR